MKYFKKLGFGCIYSFISILLLTFLLTIFSYFNIINGKFVSILKIIIPIISLFIGGFYIGKRTSKKILFEALKLGFIFSLVLIILNLIFSNPFKLKYILFYIILIGSSIMGTMVGTSKIKK